MFWINMMICVIWTTIIYKCVREHWKTRKQIYWENSEIYKLDESLLKNAQHAVYVIGVCPEHQQKIEELRKNIRTYAKDIKKKRYGHRLVNWKLLNLANVCMFLGLHTVILLCQSFKIILFNPAFLYQFFIVHLTVTLLNNVGTNAKTQAIINEAEEHRLELEIMQDELKEIVYSLHFACHIFSENVREDTTPVELAPSSNNHTLN